MSKILPIPLEKVKRGASVTNDRTHFDEASIRELAISIAKDGLAQPVTLRPVNGHYEIVAGERRTRAHLYLQENGITYTNDGGESVTVAPGTISTIDAIIKELTDEQAAAIMLAENTAREDLNPIDEANGYQSRKDQFKWSIAKLAETAGVSEDRVRRRLDLLKLTSDIQHLIAHGNLPIGHAELLVPLDVNRQGIAVRVFREAKKGLSRQQFKHIVDDLLKEQAQDSLFDLEAFWVEQVQKAQMPRRGKKAFIPAPTSKKLPPVRRNTKWSTGDIFDQYIADLIAAGFKREAEAVGNIYHTLVRHNYTSTPVNSAIPEPDEQHEVHEETGADYRA